MRGNKDFRPVIDELKTQGWEVEQTSQGHWKAVPPDKSKPVVHFSGSLEPRALKNTISELKRSGFDWPPKRPEREKTALDEWWLEDEEAEPAKEKPNLDELYESLKEAKGYLDLTGEQLAECRAKLDEAKVQYEEAMAEHEKAMKALQKKKAAFDSAFGAAA